MLLRSIIYFSNWFEKYANHLKKVFIIRLFILVYILHNSKAIPKGCESGFRDQAIIKVNSVIRKAKATFSQQAQ